jgi:hypothetical protein
LEGLEISEKNFKNILSETDYFRIDSEFQLHYYLNIIKVLHSIDHSCFNEKIELLTDGKHGGVDFTENGVVFLRNTNIKENIIDLSDLKYISEQESNETKRAEFKERDLLLTTIGTLGVCVKVPKEFPKATINQNLVRIVLKNKSEASIICSFLNSKYGRGQLLRWAAGNVYQMINYPNLKKILIPKFSSEFVLSIDNLYNKSELKYKQSQSLYGQAEELLLGTIGLKDFIPSQEKTNIKSFKESFLKTGRLDAEYYQLKYEEIEKCIKNFKLGFTRVSYKFSLSKEISNRTEEFYNYTEISDVNISDGSINYNELSVDELPDNGKMVLREGQIIISKVRPYRGAIGIIRECPKNHIGSGAFTILNEISDYKKEVLQVLLRSKPYKELIMKDNVGSSYPVVKDENILNLIIPIIDFKTQEKIASLVQESFYLRKESERLLTEAKEMVEREIEDGIYN